MPQQAGWRAALHSKRRKRAVKTVIWAAQKGDRSIWFGPRKKGGRRKVAERLVNKMKDDLFDSGF